MEKILLIEDDADIRRTNAKILAYEGYGVLQAATAAAGLASVMEDHPALIVLDVLLPDEDGFSLCRKIREISSVPILYLSCLGESADKVSGLRAGGDDYLSKPYDMDELCARIDALLRRARQTNLPALDYPPLFVDVNAGRAYLNGVDVLLTPKEFQMLVLLAQHIGRVITAERLFEALWAEPLSPDRSSEAMHAVYVRLSSLRKKLKITNDSPVQIKTIRNEGYCFLFSPDSL